MGAVIMVEDNALNRELVQALLEVDGHDVTIAESGSAFREKLRTGLVPDLVLMDMVLPDTSGTVLLAELRAMPSWRAVPVVALTAQALAGDTERFLASGFDAVITKPIDTRCFAEQVRHFTQRRAERD